jgi:hypothetical protein
LRDHHLVESARKKTGLAAVLACSVLLWASAVLMFYGCGRKDLPEPPRGKRPPAVNDLSYKVSNNTVELTWTIPATAAAAESPVTGFFIYEFKQTRMESECPNCPKFFNKIGEVPVRSSVSVEDELPSVAFVQPIDVGYRYIYKVVSVNDDEIFSRDSNEVELVY